MNIHPERIVIFVMIAGTCTPFVLSRLDGASGETARRRDQLFERLAADASLAPTISGALEQPGQAGEGEQVVVHAGSVPNGSWSYSCKMSVRISRNPVTVSRQAGIHCGVTNP